ncbi:hypothetical protein KY338_05275 [Candidatus Woesearchaeota archaeon]|nr:hypothetical protein [Candidatus Woesearchaeota archaeon]MBW3006314.1 hypothetical protein [Candidatus Woesearchaeota archaeon]
MIEELIKELNEDNKLRKIVKVLKSGVFINRQKIKDIAWRIAHVQEKKGKPVIKQKIKYNLVKELEQKHGPYYYEYTDENIDSKHPSINIGYILSRHYFDDYEKTFPESRFKRLKGRMFDCSNYIHPRDPLIVGKITLKLTDKLIATFHMNDREIDITYHGFIAFSRRACNTLMKNGTFKKAQRDRLMLLYHQLKESSEVIRKNSVLQIIEHGEKAEYRTCKGFIYVIENSELFKTCYQKDDLNIAGYKIK